MRNLSAVAAALLLATWLPGCSSDDDAGDVPAVGTTPCDPLAAATTTVASVLAAGTDANGTMYIVDTAADGQQRIFVTSGSGLVRVADLGSGQDGTSQYVFSFTSPGSSTAGNEELFVDISNGTTTMAVSPQTDTKDFAPPSDATPLTVVDPASVAGKTAQDLPGVVEFVLDVSDGTTLVITAPSEAYGTSQFRLFLGTPPTLTERRITSYNMSGDGAVGLTFDGAAGAESASIPCQTSTFCSSGSVDGTLSDASGAALSFTVRQPTPTTLDGLSFVCQ